MNTSSEAAEQLVKMSLEGIEVAAKITGSGAKNVAAMLYVISKDQQKLKGKTKLSNLLKTGKELKVFSIKKEDIKKFTTESKRYGVLFNAIVNKKDVMQDGMIDIIVKAEDAVKINQIVNRFKLATVDMATVKSTVSKIENNTKDAYINVQEKNSVTKEADEIMQKPIRKENNSFTNPQIAKMEKSPPSEHLSMSKKYLEQGSNYNKKSVKKELQKIKEKQTRKDIRLNTTKSKFKGIKSSKKKDIR